MPKQIQILKVALPLPLPQLFDYRLPVTTEVSSHSHPGVGFRVRVPFGTRELVGILIDTSDKSNTPADKLKPAFEIIDNSPCIPEELIKLAQWASNYYHHPLGEVLSAILPKRYRSGESLIDTTQQVWVHTTDGLGLPHDALTRSKKQQLLHQYLLDNQHASGADLKRLEISNAICNALQSKGLIEKKTLAESACTATPSILAEAPLALNTQQNQALESIRYHQFQCNLLQGVTGSGKTEVYMQAIARVLQSGKQALMLIPEIGLTPQTLKRFHQRFQVEIAELHSRVSELARAQNWENAKNGRARIVIGTRLAALAPLKEPGIIIIDEEHDTSFKQQDGFRYSARDLSIYRAHQANIPIVLGSATPSVESLRNAACGRYQHLQLVSRAGDAKAPLMQTVDLRKQTQQAGLSESAIAEIQKTIAAGKQALVFINRRGYAPTLYCQTCGWNAKCPNCELNYTLHQSPSRLHCHHCDKRTGVPQQCPNCHSAELAHSGAGTEQIVEKLLTLFPNTPVLQVDRDTTRNKNDMASLLEEANRGEPCILVGTQMLAKGHHLEALNLVVVIDTDQGLMSPDYKALERLGQLVTQVAGRAGRAETQGKVLLQSYQPEHPALQLLIHSGYSAFADAVLLQRQTTQLPPYSYSVLFRAESKRAENALALLSLIKRSLQTNDRHRLKANPEQKPLRIIGPFPAIIEKLNQRFRFQLHVYSEDRRHLHQILDASLAEVQQNALSKRTRWSLDVDPVEQL